MRAMFFAKAMPYQLKPDATGGYGSEFTIEKVINLTKREYAAFLKTPLADYDFIKENKELMWRDEDGVRHCILIMVKEAEEGILIEAEGYNWARYAAYLSLK